MNVLSVAGAFTFRVLCSASEISDGSVAFRLALQRERQ